MKRSERLKAIANAHDEWVEGLDMPEEAKPFVPDSGVHFEDANQFGADLDGPQEEFLAKLPQEESESPTDTLDKAIEGLSALIDVLRQAK